jgi:hypothetical protein
VRSGDQFARGRDAVGLREVQCGAALSGVEILEQAAAQGVRSTAGKGPPAAQRVSRGRLDLDDLGTEVDEKLCGVRT